MAVSRTLPPPPPMDDIGPVSLFLDFDGTLVEIASGPDAIEVPEDLASRLHTLADRLDGRLAIVSGRDIANLQDYLGPVTFHMAGSHGAHVVGANNIALAETKGLDEDVKAALSNYAARHEGLLYERKRHGAALHYRGCPELEDHVRTFVEGVASAHDLATKAGKSVVEVVRPGSDKAGAVELILSQPLFASATPVFVGDDVTDEDGFAACERLGGFGIVIGDRDSTAARYRLESVRDVYQWLRL